MSSEEHNTNYDPRYQVPEEQWAEQLKEKGNLTPYDEIQIGETGGRPNVYKEPHTQNPQGWQKPYEQLGTYETQSQYNPYGQSGMYESQSRYKTRQVDAKQPDTADMSSYRGAAIASLVTGICAIVFSVFIVFSIPLSIAGIITGFIYIANRKDKRGMAIAGIITSIIGFITSVLLIVLVFVAMSQVSNPYYDYNNPDYYDYYDGYDYYNNDLL